MMKKINGTNYLTGKKIIFILGISTIVFFAGCHHGKTGNSTADSDSAVVGNWKLGVQMWTFRLFDFTQALDKVDSAGIKNIEAFWGQPLGGGMKDSFGIRMSVSSRKELKNLLKQKDMHIVAMGVISPGTKEEWEKAFELAKAFGMSYITAEPRKGQWDMIDSLAGAYGINVAIHDHPRPDPYWHPDSVLAAVRGHIHLGACADIGHWARNGLDPVTCLKSLQGHVYGVHLKDITQFNNVDAADTVVGKGIIDFPAVFEELKRQKFDGMISIEHESNWLHSLPDIIETADYYYKEVKKLE